MYLILLTDLRANDHCSSTNPCQNLWQLPSFNLSTSQHLGPRGVETFVFVKTA